MPSFSTLYQTAGPVSGIFDFQKSLIVKHEFGYQHIRNHSNGCIQIQWSKYAHADWFSYAIENPEIVEPAFLQNENEIQVNLTIEIRIETATGISTWFHNGKILGGLEPGLGFGFLGEKSVACIHLNENEQFFGLGEKTGGLNRRGAAFTNWNTDAFAYGDNRDPIYASIPFYMSFQEGECHGVFLDCTSRSRFNFGASNHRMVQITVETGPLNLIFIPGPTPSEVLKRYSDFTGRTPQPPKWALGLHQSRYSYRTQNEVEALAAQYRFRDIPLDCIHLDIHYMDSYKVFSVNEKAFPSLKKMSNQLKKEGIRLVAIQDPGIKNETGYAPLELGTKQEVFLKYPDGQYWEASVWPGVCRFPDFTKPEGREWWAELTQDWVKETGISGLWNDMNEPATWGQDVPDMVEFNLEGRRGNHLEAHNVYGQLMAKSTRNGLSSSRSGERPFVLTRAGFAGIQRYATVWTGDNIASTEHMFLGIRLILSLSISGVPFSGVDVGGFVGDSSRNLFVRWMSIAAFFPFLRIHSMIDSKASEPWTYGELAEAISRNYIRLRYRLLPMWESAFHQHSENGLPIISPYFWKTNRFEFKSEFQHQFLFGDQLLVVPADPDKDAVWAELPVGNWYHLSTGQKVEGGRAMWVSAPIDQLPVYVSESAILVTKTPGRSTCDPEAEEYQLHIFWGEKSGTFQFHRLDSEGQRPATSQILDASITFNPNERGFEISLERINRSKAEWKILEILLWHFPLKRGKRLVSIFHKQQIECVQSTFDWLDTLPDFDPFESKASQYFNKCLRLPVAPSTDSETILLEWI